MECERLLLQLALDHDMHLEKASPYVPVLAVETCRAS